MIDTDSPTTAAGRFLPAPDGGRIFTWITEPTQQPLADVVIIPPFGMGVSDLFLPAHVLVENGFRVVRFDGRDSVGRSSGSIIDYRLGTLRQDATRVVEACTGARPLIVVGLSLSGPVAWGLAGEVDAIGVVALVPAADVPATVERASGALIDPYRRAEPALPRTVTIFGYEVDAGQFVADMDNEGHRDLDAACARVSDLPVDLLLVAASDDEYVRPSETRAIVDAAGRVELVIIEGSSHELGRSVSATRQAMSHVADFCLRTVGATATAQLPSMTTLINASQQESALLSQPASSESSSPLTEVPR